MPPSPERFRRPRPHPHKPPRPPQGPAQTPQRPGQTDWDHVASWYDKLVGEEGSDYHQHVVLPAAVRMLEVRAGERVLDLCCGQGVFCRLIAQAKPALVVGVDASKRLIEAARHRTKDRNVRYIIADARNLGELADGSFDASGCIMAVHDLDPVEPLFAELSRALRPGGRAVVILMHPCFRIPRQSSWGWDEQAKTQYRRLDRYNSPLSVPIATHPGSEPSQHTVFFHRPLAAYLNALGRSGLRVDACEELLSHRQSQPGGHSRGENRARQEFPVFLALRAIKAV